MIIQVPPLLSQTSFRGLWRRTIFSSSLGGISTISEEVENVPNNRPLCVLLLSKKIQRFCSKNLEIQKRAR